MFWIAIIIGIATPFIIKYLPPLPDPSVSGQACTLSSVHDGDTVRAVCEGEMTKIRLYCIDTPELAQRPWGQESRDHLRAILPDTLRLVVHDTDRYGRKVGDLISPQSGESFNLRMVEDGLAAVYPKYCDEARFYRAEERAKAAGNGIWRRPGEHQRPWDFRR